MNSQLNAVVPLYTLCSQINNLPNMMSSMIIVNLFRNTDHAFFCFFLFFSVSNVQVLKVIKGKSPHLFSEENKVLRRLFEARKMAGSATYKQSKTE